MAQIHVFGRVMHDLVPKEGQTKQPYVCFDLMERNGGNQPDFYQVWARGDAVARLMKLKVRKGSMIWLTGSQKLVDVRQKDGSTGKNLAHWEQKYEKEMRYAENDGYSFIQRIERPL